MVVGGALEDGVGFGVRWDGIFDMDCELFL
jgi:hypothetical protein